MNDKNIENNDIPQLGAVQEHNEKTASDIFATREIEIEEVAIDGICGVY